MRLNSSHAAADQRREDTGTEDGEKDRRGFGTGRGFCSIYQDMFVCVLERFGPVVSQHWMVSVIGHDSFAPGPPHALSQLRSTRYHACLVPTYMVRDENTSRGRVIKHW